VINKNIPRATENNDVVTANLLKYSGFILMELA
jgi:hypothetical protein